MAYQASAEDLLQAAILGGMLLGRGPASGGYAGGAVSGGGGGSEGVILRAISGMAGQPTGANVTGAPMAPGVALRNQPAGRTISEADIMRIKAQYGAKEYPQKDHITRTLLAHGAHNKDLNRAVASDAARMQNLDFHNNVLFKYLRPGMTQREAHEAVKRGFKEERNVPAYWDDLKPRRDMSVHSDAVHAIRITPDGRIEIKWRGKPSKKNPSGWYTFKQYPDTHAASMAAKQLIMSDSLGHAVAPWQRNGKPIKYKTANMSWWNRKNYDGAFAV